MKSFFSPVSSTVRSGAFFVALNLGVGFTTELLSQDDATLKEAEKTKMRALTDLPPRAVGGAITTIEFNGGVVRVQGDAALNVVVTQNGQNVQVQKDSTPVADSPADENPPETEEEKAAKQEFFEGLVAARRTSFESSMEKEIERLEKSLQLDQEAVEKLIEGAIKAVDTTMEAWKGPAAEWFELSAKPRSDGRVSIFTSAPDRLLNRIQVAGLLLPTEQPLWKEQLDAALTPEQRATLNEKEAKEQRELDQKIADWAANMENVQRNQLTRRLGPMTADIGNLLALEPRRMERLRQLAEKAFEKAGEQYRDGLVRDIKQKTRREQEAAVSRGGFAGAITMIDPKDTDVWKEGLEAFLTEEEKLKLAEAAKRRESLLQVASREMVMLMVESQLVLSTEQVELLRPLIDPAAEKVAQMMDQVNLGYYSVDAPTVGNALKESNLERFKESLDPAQLEALRTFLSGQTSQNNLVAKRMQQASKMPVPTSEAERDQMANDFLLSCYEESIKRIMVSYECEIAEVDRSAKLSESEKDDLALLAKGMVQEASQSIRQSLGANVRQNLGSVPLEQVPQRLVNFGAGFFNWTARPSDSPMWQLAIENLLDEERREKWLAERNARLSRLSESQKSLVMFQADRVAGLSEEQAKELGVKVEVVLEKHGPALEKLKSMIGRDWYSYNHTVLVPLAGVPEEELKSILTKNQLDQLKPAMTQTRHYWSQIEGRRGSTRR
jgi:hypothetical protein